MPSKSQPRSYIITDHVLFLDKALQVFLIPRSCQSPRDAAAEPHYGRSAHETGENEGHPESITAAGGESYL